MLSLHEDVIKAERTRVLRGFDYINTCYSQVLEYTGQEISFWKMKPIIVFSVIFQAGSAAAAVCPFSLLKRAGLLNPRDEAAYDAVKADPNAAEEIFASHHQARDPEKLGDGLLDLPLGGGLCK